MYLAIGVLDGGWVELVEGQEGDLPGHLLLVHDGEDLRRRAVRVNDDVKQPANTMT